MWTSSLRAYLVSHRILTDPAAVGQSIGDKRVVEAVLAPEPGGRYPIRVAGKRACPPEDRGGPWGHGELQEAIGALLHPAHADRLTWPRGPFDPETFDVADLNRRLAKPC